MAANGLSSHRLDNLIASVAAGSTEALGALYQAVSPSVYSYALSILKSAHDAEDVLQDCFLNIRSYAADYRSQGKPMAWILTIAKNLCMQQLRQRKRYAELPPEDWQTAVHTGSEMTAEDKLVIFACLQHLSENQRQIVVLHIVAQLKFRQIAQFLNMPLSTVLSSYRRAIQKMRSLL